MKKKALVTGASRGIGKAIAKRLAEEKIDLILTCNTNFDVLQDFAYDLTSQHNIKCSAYKCDAGDPNQVRKLFLEHGDVDIVVNNAGISYVGLLQDMDLDDWNHVINTNLNSVFYTSRLAIEYMLKQQSGCIINISSIWGETGASMEVAYSASKGGVNSFTKALAKELAPSHIKVNAIACGVIDTDMNNCFSDDEKLDLAESIPVGRFGKPEEIAEIVYRIIDAPEYLTGQIITVDGGFI